MNWTEEQIAAHVDGTLSPAEDAAIRDILARDREARAVADRLRALNRLLADAYPLPADEMPAGIAGALAAAPGAAGAARDRPAGEGQVVRLRPRRRAPAWLPMALAASVALAVGIGIGAGGGALLPGVEDGAPSGPVLADAGPALDAALTNLASGELSPAGIRPISTFRNAEGQPCREFESAGADAIQSGIACHLPGGDWDLLALITLPGRAERAEAETGFAPAAGAAGIALDKTLAAIGAGPPLKPGEEAALIDSGWQ